MSMGPWDKEKTGAGAKHEGNQEKDKEGSQASARVRKWKVEWTRVNNAINVSEDNGKTGTGPKNEGGKEQRKKTKRSLEKCKNKKVAA